MAGLPKMMAEMGTPVLLSNSGLMQGQFIAGAVKRELGCAPFEPSVQSHFSPFQFSAFFGGFLSMPSHQTVLSSRLRTTLVKMVFFLVAASALGLDFSLVPGATPKKPFSGFTAHNLPSGPMRSHAISSPTVQGVFVGSIMASETTAAATGKVGVVRRDPMAMRPFCGYNMGDYWQHWIDMGKKLSNPPKIFNVNWFRTDDEGNFEWPGFGDNMRVVEWILGRCFGEVGAVETELGYEPKAEDINLDGSGVSEETLEDLLKVDKSLWLDECKGIREYYAQFGDKLPKELASEIDALEERLKK